MKKQIALSVKAPTELLDDLRQNPPLSQFGQQ